MEGTYHTPQGHVVDPFDVEGTSGELDAGVEGTS